MSDLNKNVIFMNPVAEKLTGWSAESGMGNPLAPILNAMQIMKHAPGDGSLQNRVQSIIEKQVHLCC